MRTFFLAAAIWCTATIASAAAPPLWPPTGYVCGQPVRNFWRFCGDCQIRQAVRVERWRALQQQPRGVTE